MSDGLMILALDASTKATGVVIVHFPVQRAGWEVPAAVLLSARHIEPETLDKADTSKPGFDTMTARLSRIRAQRALLSAFLTGIASAIDLVAYERPFVRGQGATEALMMALGAYLTLPQLSGLPVLPVHGASVKAVFHGHQLAHAPNATNKAKDAKRAILKASCREWAVREFGEAAVLSEDVADALAVAVAAHRLTGRTAAKEAEAAIQRPLFGKGSGTKRGISSGGPRKAKTTEEATAAVAEVA